ncbi:MAG: sensor histidine kinase [Deltaproteobacteria bacterium]
MPDLSLMDLSPGSTPPRGLPLRWLLVGCTTLIAVAATGAVGAISEQLLGRTLIEQLRAQQEAGAAIAAQSIDGTLIGLLASGGRDSPLERRFDENLRALARDGNLERAAVIDSAGTILASSDPADLAGETDSRLAIHQAALRDAAHGVPRSGAFFYGKDAVPHLVTFAPIHGAGTVAAVLAVETPANHLAAVARLRRQVLLLGMFVSAIVGVISFALAAVALGPISRITEAAKALGEGKLSARVGRVRQRELGLLARTFDHMADALQERTSEVQRLSAESLRRQEDRSRAILDALSSSVVLLDGADRPVEWNPAAERLLEAIGGFDRIGDLLIGESSGGLLRATGPAGDRHLRRSRLSLPTAEPNRSAKLLVLDDLTDLHELQDRIRRQEHLAMVGQMAAQVAHEIRNPLNSISLSLGLLSTDDALERNRSRIDAIASEISQLNGILTEFLQLSRPISLEKRALPAREILRAVVALLEAQAREAGIELSIAPASEDALVEVDGAEIRRALINLTLNSLEAVPRGGHVLLRASRTSRPSGLPMLAFEVTDDGPGISHAIRPHLFEPFFTTKPTGTGLGLAMVQRIAVAHGGTCEALEGTPGPGASFRLTVPC